MVATGGIEAPHSCIFHSLAKERATCVSAHKRQIWRDSPWKMTKKWAKHRQRITSLYLDDNKPLHEVQSIMKDQQKFTASTRAYRHRFMKWGLSKYSPQRRRTSTSSAGSSYDAPEPTRPTVPLWPSVSYPLAEPASPLFSSPEMGSYAQVYSPESTE
ncbi:hypothetical protein MCOR06_010985 [Pyricularia oryzae]|nr:hypothetical protein MCOR06_010985 [Pyricularia oryzae]